MKRIAIYVHYEKKGRFLNFEKFFVSELLKDFSKVIVVANGEIDETDLTGFDSVEIVRRENKGFDFGAWKDVITERYEREIKNYEQLLITNNSIYGPVGTFSEMISEMDKRNCDFWGINRHPAKDCCIIKGDDATRCYEHLQSYWIVFKSRLLRSNDFISYWRNLPELDTFIKAVGYGEVRLTHHFEQLGYSSGSFADFQKYSSLSDLNPCFFTYEQVKEDRIPVIKRKYFYDYFEQAASFNIELKARQLLDYLSSSGLYNIDYIREDLYSAAGFRQLFHSLGLFRCLPEMADTAEKKGFNKTKLLLVINDRTNRNAVTDWLKMLASDWELVVIKTSVDLDDNNVSFTHYSKEDLVSGREQEPVGLMIINSLEDCSVSSLCHVTDELQKFVPMLRNPGVSGILAGNSGPSLLVPFPHVSGEFSNLAIQTENYTQPVVFCYGRINIISAFVKSLLNNDIEFTDGRFLEYEAGAGEILNENCCYAEYFTGRDGDLVSNMYYQLGNVHQATEDVEILSKIERQIKRIKRNNLFAGIFRWKRKYYKLKNRRHMKMIEKLLRYR